MKTSDFTITLLVDQSPEEIFNAVNNVRGWWGKDIEGAAEKLNDEFVYRYADLHATKQKLVEVVPNRKVTWLVTDCVLSFVEHKDEWNGTKVVFDISRKGNQTQLRFTHEGLTPAKECFDACSGGWSYYVKESLLPFITTGKGHPEKEW